MSEITTYVAKCWNEALDVHERWLTLIAFGGALLTWPISIFLGGVIALTDRGLIWLSGIAFLTAIFLLFFLAPFRLWKRQTIQINELNELSAANCTRDKSVSEALAFMMCGSWNQNVGEAFLSSPDTMPDLTQIVNKFRQAAVDGKLIVWGCKRKGNPHERIPSDFWISTDIEWFDMLEHRPRTQPKSTHHDSTYFDLMTSRAQIEKLWPTPKPLERLPLSSFLKIAANSHGWKIIANDAEQVDLFYGILNAAQERRFDFLGRRQRTFDHTKIQDLALPLERIDLAQIEKPRLTFVDGDMLKDNFRIKLLPLTIDPGENVFWDIHISDEPSAIHWLKHEAGFWKGKTAQREAARKRQESIFRQELEIFDESEIDEFANKR